MKENKYTIVLWVLAILVAGIAVAGVVFSILKNAG